MRAFAMLAVVLIPFAAAAQELPTTNQRPVLKIIRRLQQPDVGGSERLLLLGWATLFAWSFVLFAPADPD
jgi:hypothetical protein